MQEHPQTVKTIPKNTVAPPKKAPSFEATYFLFVPRFGGVPPIPSVCAQKNE